MAALSWATDILSETKEKNKKDKKK